MVTSERINNTSNNDKEAWVTWHEDERSRLWGDRAWAVTQSRVHRERERLSLYLRRWEAAVGYR